MSLSTLGQSSLDEKMLNATCQCITFVLNPGSNADDTFEKCAMKNIGSDSILLKKECLLVYGDTSKESFSKYGSDFFKRNSVNLIYKCDAYFAILDSMRFSKINGLNKDTIRSLLESLNQTDLQSRGKEFFNKRGLFYFALHDYSNSLADFDTSLIIDSNLVPSLVFKGLILEVQKKYDAAIKIYEDLAQRTKDNNFSVFAAIARRKKNSL